MQFVPDSYTVIEGNQAQLMLELSGAVNRDVSVQLRTMDGSAEGMLVIQVLTFFGMCSSLGILVGDTRA